MYGLACPNCAAPLGEGTDNEDTSVCASCGWREQPETAAAKPRPAGAAVADDDEVMPRPVRRRKKKRPPEPDPVLPNPLGEHPFARSMAILVGLWGILIALTLLTSSAAYWLVALGVLTLFGAVVGILIAAHKDGIGLGTVWVRSPMLLMILWMLQFMFVPFVSAIHMLINFPNAWRPALVLLIGVAMIASGIALEPGIVLAQ